jgi:hypothetical protein
LGGVFSRAGRVALVLFLFLSAPVGAAFAPIIPNVVRCSGLLHSLKSVLSDKVQRAHLPRINRFVSDLAEIFSETHPELRIDFLPGALLYPYPRISFSRAGTSDLGLLREMEFRIEKYPVGRKEKQGISVRLLNSVSRVYPEWAVDLKRELGGDWVKVRIPLWETDSWDNEAAEVDRLFVQALYSKWSSETLYRVSDYLFQLGTDEGFREWSNALASVRWQQVVVSELTKRFSKWRVPPVLKEVFISRGVSNVGMRGTDLILIDIETEVLLEGSVQRSEWRTFRFVIGDGKAIEHRIFGGAEGPVLYVAELLPSLDEAENEERTVRAFDLPMGEVTRAFAPKTKPVTESLRSGEKAALLIGIALDHWVDSLSGTLISDPFCAERTPFWKRIEE